MPSSRRDRRTAILHVAEKEFAERGFDGVGMREIAAQVGIHSATLYHYFSGKEELFFAVIERIYQEAREWIQESLQHPMEGRAKLAFFIERQFDFLTTHKSFLKILLHELQCQSPRIEKLVAHFVKPLADILASLLEGMCKDGIIRSVDNRQALFQIMTLNAGHIIFAPLLGYIMLVGDPLAPDYLEAQKRANIELLLYGLENAPECSSDFTGGCMKDSAF